MDTIGHPRVVVGVDGSLTGLAALRAAVGEARRRGLPLYAVRSRTTAISLTNPESIKTAFLDALGSYPADVQIETAVSTLPIRDALRAAACDPRDLLVVGTSGKGPWHALWSGSVARALLRRARCPVLAVPAPEMAHTVHRPHAGHRRSQWDPLRELENQRPEFHGRPYSGI